MIYCVCCSVMVMVGLNNSKFDVKAAGEFLDAKVRTRAAEKSRPLAVRYGSTHQSN